MQNHLILKILELLWSALQLVVNSPTFTLEVASMVNNALKNKDILAKTNWTTL